MKILITGGAGFIGSHIAEALAAKNHSVIVLDNLSSGTPQNLAPDIALRQVDIQNHQAVTDLLTSEKFDAIFHLAAQIDVRASVANPLADAETNILASLHLLDTAAKTGVGTFIFSSSGGAIYGDTAIRPTPETHPEHPLSPYGIGKLTLDKYLAFYQNHASLRTVSLRYGNVYGPRQNPHGEAGVVSIFLQKMLQGQNPVINGEGTQTRDYIFVEDIARANILALENQMATGVYNIGTGTETSVNELFSFLNAHFDQRYRESHGPAKPGEQATSSLDANRAQTELGWQSTISLQEGLQKTYDYFQKQMKE